MNDAIETCKNGTGGSEDVICGREENKMAAGLWLKLAFTIYIFIVVPSRLTSTNPNNKLLFDFGY